MPSTETAQDIPPQQTNGTGGFSSTGPTSRSGKRSTGFEITGADGKTFEIPAGEFYFNPKARARRMMQNSLSADARRVYACLELHTMGWQQEKAVIMEAGKVRPLIPADIAAETGLSKRDVRRVFEELENEGLAERREIVAGKGLTNGNVAIYSWAFPLSAEGRRNGEGIGGAVPIPVPAWFPKSWKSLIPLIKHRKLVVSIDEEAARCLITEGEEAARDYKKALDAAARFLERVCAASKKQPHIKEERTKEPNTKEPPPTGRAEKSSPVVEDPPEPPPPEPPPARPPDGSSDKDSPLRTQLREYLASRPVPTSLDGAMFERIARWITTAEKLEGFIKASDEVQNPRKWAVYESIAQQVHAREQIPKRPAKEDPLVERMRQNFERRKAWESD